jgi:hypothetical protein
VKRTNRSTLNGLAVPGLALLLAQACSLTIDMKELRGGCGDGLINCNGECVSEDTGCQAGGLGNNAGSSGMANGGSGDETSTGGTADPGSGGDGPIVASGGEAGSGFVLPEVCVVEYKFMYEPLVDVESVNVTGTFTTWDTVGLEMTADVDGVYSAIVELDAPASYKYKFIEDGVRWVQDPKNPNAENDGFVGKNSILNVDCDHDYSNGPLFWPVDGEGGAGGSDSSAGAGGAPAAGATSIGGAGGAL